MNLKINIYIILILVFATQAAYARDFPQTRDTNTEELPSNQDSPLQAGRKQ